MIRALALVLALAAACRKSPPPMHTCADPLAGVWRGPDGERYHVLDYGPAVELFPMWNAAAGDRSPPRIRLQRAGERVEGSWSFRLSTPARTCVVTQPVRLSGCDSGRAVLERKELVAVDQATCAAQVASNYTRVPLRRE